MSETKPWDQASSFAASLKDLTPEAKAILRKKPVNEIKTEAEFKLRLSLMEEELEQVKIQRTDDTKSADDLSGLSEEDEVMMDVPAMPTGEMFQINQTKYFGKCRIQLRTAAQLNVLISEAYRHERELMISRGNADKGHGKFIQIQTGAHIQRFKEIMGDA